MITYLIDDYIPPPDANFLLAMRFNGTPGKDSSLISASACNIDTFGGILI